MCTKKGVIKKTELTSFSYFKTRAIRAINLDEGDELSWVLNQTDKKTLFLQHLQGWLFALMKNSPINGEHLEVSEQ